MAVLLTGKISITTLICRIRDVGHRKGGVAFEQLQEGFC